MPSATAKTFGSASTLSSFSGRMRPGSVAAAQRNVGHYRASSTVWPTWTRSPG